MKAQRLPTGHKLISDGPPGSLKSWTWRCECGGWGPVPTPDKGPFGSTTSKARIAQVEMAHGKHVKYALIKKDTK
jgi:hypothetical protein